MRTTLKKLFSRKKDSEIEEKLFYSQTKGQAAVEYLMTYGWMLLAVATIGTTAFQMMGTECVPTETGFEGQDVQIDDFGVDADNDFQLAISNRGAETVEISEIMLQPEGTEEVDEWDEIDSEVDEINPGQTVSLTIEEGGYTTDENSCMEIDTELVYDTGPLENLQSSGTIIAPVDRVPREELEDFVEIESLDGESIEEDQDIDVRVQKNTDDLEDAEVFIDGDLEGTTDDDGILTLTSDNWDTGEEDEEEYDIEAQDPDPESELSDLFTLTVFETVEIPEPPEISSAEAN